MKKLFITLFILIVIGICTSVAYAGPGDPPTPDPAVTLISPPETEAIVADNLLISIKVTQPGKILKISAGALQVKSGDVFVAAKAGELEDYHNKKDDEKQVVSVLETKTFESKGFVSFFTHRIEEITPGIYAITVHTVNSSGEVVYGKTAYVQVREKTKEDEKVLFDSLKPGPSLFLQNLLSKIFKN